MVREICGTPSKFSRSPPKLFYFALLVRFLLDPPEFLHYPKKKKIPAAPNKLSSILEKAHHQLRTI